MTPAPVSGRYKDEKLGGRVGMVSDVNMASSNIFHNLCWSRNTDTGYLIFHIAGVGGIKE